MPNWRTLEAKDRLLAAVVASNSDKKLLDYRRIATYYGEGTTYDAIEGQFRAIRKEAQKLRDAVDSGEHEEAPARGLAVKNRSNASRPQTTNNANRKKAGTARVGGSGSGSGSGNLNVANGVISGRVTKTKSSSPATGRKTAVTAANITSRVFDAGDLANRSNSRSSSSFHRSSSAALDNENSFVSIKKENTGDDRPLGNFMEDDFASFLRPGQYQEDSIDANDDQFNLHLDGL